MTKESSHKKLKGFFIGVNLTIVMGLATFPTISANIREKSSYQNNVQLLDSYNKYLNDYAKDFDLKELEDIDVFVKIMDEIKRENTYKRMEDIPYGYERLFLYENHFGDCSNMADDMTAKLNKLNSMYNARNLDVKMETADEISINFFDQFLNDHNIKANHSVTVVDIGEDSIVLDPTNQVIGTIKDGKIILFDSDLKMHLTPFSSYMKNGITDLVSIEKDIVKSYHNDHVKELQEKYGKDAQEKAKQKI
ncbi:MAG: hypothetical protein IJ193_03465, partial [Bacilli bacterium]|nr:hypothetical protein [Bacilli bacterium]